MAGGDEKKMVTLASFGAGALNVIVMVLLIIFVVAFIGAATWLFFKWKKYNQYEIVIWKKDGFGNLVSTTDKGGVFVDKKTKNKRLYLKKSYVGLSPDNIPYITQNKKKVVFVLQTGHKNFRYIKPNIGDPKVSFQVGEEDVNWGLNAYEAAKNRFSQNLLLQLMPFIIVGFVTIIILIIFIYFFKQFSVLKDVAVAFQEAAKSLALAQAPGQIIP